MTEEPRPRKVRPPALASRILAIGASTAAAIGLVGAMAARQPAPPASAEPAGSQSPRPIRVVVRLHHRAASTTVRKPSTVTQAPRIVRRYVAARKTTSTRGS